MDQNNEYTTVTDQDRAGGTGDTIGTDYIPGEHRQVSKGLFKKNVNFTIGALLLYLVILYGFELLWEVLALVRKMIAAGSDQMENVLDSYAENAGMSGASSLAGIAIGALFLFFFYRKRFKPREILESGSRRMTPVIFVKLVCVMMAVQLVSSLGNGLLEYILNLMGLTAQKGVDAISNLTATASMALYAGILGPISEELVFRGFTMKSFGKYGKLFGIVMSSLLFGLFHSNYVQVPFAVVVGLVFAYTAAEYGIVWSMALHIFNNFVFAMGLEALGKHMTEIQVLILEYVLMGIFFIAGLVILIRERHSIAEYVRINRTEKPRYRWALTTVTFIVFAVVTLGLGLVFIGRLE